MYEVRIYDIRVARLRHKRDAIDWAKSRPENDVVVKLVGQEHAYYDKQETLRQQLVQRFPIGD